MHQHHQEAIDKFLEIYTKDGSVLGLLLGGSLAHGFAKIDSDIDILIIVDANEYEKRKQENKLAFSVWDICTYENGYIDCKVCSIEYMKKVAEYGSDPSRYAFKDSKILYSKIDSLKDLLAQIEKFPNDKIDDRRNRFASQILAWKWYYSEGIKKENKYIQFLAIQKLILFACRIVFNENKTLYPYHKWMLSEVKNVDRKPENFIETIDSVLSDHNLERVNQFADSILSFIDYTDKTVDWPNYFLHDSEQNWLEHEPPVDDL